MTLRILCHRGSDSLARDLAERHHDIRAHARTIAGLLEEIA